MSILKKVLLSLGVLALAFAVNIPSAQAVLTFDATSMVGTTDITIRSTAGSAITVGDSAQTGTISIGTSTGAMTLNLGTGNSAKTINLGTGTAVDTINIGTGGTGADVITIGTTAGAASLTLQSGTGDVTVTSTDDILLTPTDDVTWTLAAGSVVTFDASTTANTGTTGVIDLNVGAGNAAVDGLNISITQNDGATAATDATAIELLLTGNDADGDMFGITIVGAATTNAGAGTYEAAISIDNAENTAGSMTDAILVTSSGINAGVTDAIDVSAANITNAINIGANNVLSTGTVTFSRSDAGTITLTAVDDDATAAITLDAGGAAGITIGSADVTSIVAIADNDFQFQNGATGSVTFDFRDYADTADDDMAHAILTVNCTDATSGAEDCDFTIGVVEAGAAAETRFNIDADGGITLGSSNNNSFTVTTDSTGDAEVVLPAASIGEDELTATLTFDDADLIDLGAILHNDAAAQGLRLPNVGASPTDITGTTEGYIAWDETNNRLLVNDGSAWVTGIGNTTAENTWTDNQIYTFGADEDILINASTTASTLTTGVLNLDVNAGDAAVDGLNIALVQNDGAATGRDAKAIEILLTGNDADGDVFGLEIVGAATANATTGTYEAGIFIDNAEDSASSMTDGILITSSGVNGGVVDGIDVSAANITNAINIGANNIQTGTGGTVTFARSDAGTVTLTAVDDDTTAALTLDAGGAAAITIGSADVTSIVAIADNDFQFQNGATGSVTFDFRDYADTADDDMAHAILTVNCTDATSGAEDCDFTIGVVEAGAAAETRFNIDADGGITLGSANTNSLTITTDNNAANDIAITGGLTLTGTLTVGVDDTGHDVQFFGATASAHLLWDESDDDLELNGNAGFTEVAQTLTANTNSGAGSSIVAGKRAANVTGVTTDANDWIVLPAIADVPFGHTIRITANAGGNFELRTVAGSNTTINNVDSDGTQEYLVTNTDTVIVTKHLATGWIAQSITNLGAVRTAVVPD